MRIMLKKSIHPPFSDPPLFIEIQVSYPPFSPPQKQLTPCFSHRTISVLPDVACQRLMPGGRWPMGFIRALPGLALVLLLQACTDSLHHARPYATGRGHHDLHPRRFHRLVAGAQRGRQRPRESGRSMYALWRRGGADLERLHFVDRVEEGWSATLYRDDTSRGRA